MRLVVQRVRQASVVVSGVTVGAIEHGFLVLVGVGQGDTTADAVYLSKKVAGLRVFADADDRMNLSILEVGGKILVVSQFTLLGDCRKGRRPAFTAAAEPDLARSLYQEFSQQLQGQGIGVETGVFAADMQVHSTNDGPVTLLLDSRKTF